MCEFEVSGKIEKTRKHLIFILYVSYLSLALQTNETVFAEEAQKHRNGRTILTHKF